MTAYWAVQPNKKSTGLFFFVLVQGGWHFGENLAEDSSLCRSATGITLATIVLMQIGNLIGRRSLDRSGIDLGLVTNKLFLIGIALELAFSWGLLYWPPLATVLGTAPVAWQIYASAYLGIPLMFTLDWLRKKIVAYHRC